MRKIFLFMLVSVDGYFEGPNHDLSWHNVDAEFSAFANEQLGDIGTLLFGHRTYELMAGVWPAPLGTMANPTTAKLMNTISKVVVSRALFNAGWNNTAVVSGDAIGGIKELKKLPGKDIAIFGSNNLLVSLMEHDLVDEFRIMVNPVALGRGTPLFAGLGKRVPFRLVGTRRFKSGNVLNYYVRA